MHRFLSMEPDLKGISNVLVVTDHFTRYAQAFPTRNQKALTVAKVLVEKYLCIMVSQAEYTLTKVEISKAS